MKTRLFSLIFLGGLTAYLNEAPVCAQSYPSKPVAEMPKAQLEELAQRRAQFVLDNSQKAPLPSKDGLELVVKPTNSQAGFGGEVICSLVNHNAFEVRYSLRSITMGFVFFLYDNSGSKIELSPEWEWANMPYTHDVRSHQIHTVKPGESLEFTLKLTEAYGERWKQGKRLVVEWDPTSFRAGSEFTVGLGIRAEMQLVSLNSTPTQSEHSVSPELIPPRAEAALRSQAGPPPASPSMESITSPLWIIMAVLAVAVLALLCVWLLKRRVRRDIV